jgi:hypothetical protein
MAQREIRPCLGGSVEHDPELKNNASLLGHISIIDSPVPPLYLLRSIFPSLDLKWLLYMGIAAPIIQIVDQDVFVGTACMVAVRFIRMNQASRTNEIQYLGRLDHAVEVLCGRHREWRAHLKGAI